MFEYKRKLQTTKNLTKDHNRKPNRKFNRKLKQNIKNISLIHSQILTTSLSGTIHVCVYISQLFIICNDFMVYVF